MSNSNVDSSTWASHGQRSRFRRMYQALIDFIALVDRIVTAPINPRQQQDHVFLSNGVKSSGETDRSQPEYVHIEGFTSSSTKLVLFLILSLITGGVLPLVCRWKPFLWCKLVRRRSASFRESEFVLLKGQDGFYMEVPVQRIKKAGEWRSATESVELRYFEYRKQRYVYSEVFSSFQRQVAKLKGSFSEIHGMRYGHTVSDASSLLQAHGPNEIGIDITPLSKLVLDKITHPFYIFQMFSVAVWLYIQYTTYAILILVLSVISITWEIYTTRKNDRRLRNMTYQKATYPVMRDGVLVNLDFKDLVVGDVIVLSADPDRFIGQEIACDLVLIQGECVMDESSLTGESIPAVKTPLPQSDTDHIQPEKDKAHILFCGSDIIELKPKAAVGSNSINSGDFRVPPIPAETAINFDTSSGTTQSPNDTSLDMVLGIVMATGFSSSKGELFRSILFPVFIDLKFQRDSYKFLFMLGMLALGAIIFRIKELMASGESLLYAILGCLDLITIAVPPALPLMLTVGVGFAMTRLKASGVFCINPDRMNYAGRVNVMCWDKTGTLTVPHMIFCGINCVVYPDHQPSLPHHRNSQTRTTSQTSFISESVFPSIPSFTGLLNKPRIMEDTHPLTLEHCMVACHTLHVQEGKTIGHSLDVEMLKAIGWIILPPELTSTNNPNNTPFPVEVHLIPDAHMKSSHHSDSTNSAHTAIGPDGHGMYVYKRFRFDSQLQRTSVIASPVPTASSQEVFAYAKGSPESIRQICTLDSIPHDFNAICHMYSIQGYYVIACAGRAVSSSMISTAITSSTGDSFIAESHHNGIANIQRRHIERNMTFLGFLLFENPIKEESYDVIDSLRQAKIRSIIITGDNALTAVHVSRQLGLCQDHVLLIDIHGGSSNNTHQYPQVMFTRVPSERFAGTSVASKSKDLSASMTSLHISKSSALPRTQSFPTFSRVASAGLDDILFVNAGSDAPPEWHMIEELVSYLSRQDQHSPSYSNTNRIEDQIEIAITGAAMELLAEQCDGTFLKWLVGRARIFSRTKPTQKTWIIEQLILQGKCVAMCGDGTNDCGALKAAHIGVALSEAEASIVAPFTSANKQVTDIPLVFREGRCAIETSFIAFKFMTLYPVIQFTLAMAMHHYGTVMSNNQYLFDDMAIVTALALLMLYTRPQSQLSSDRPTDNLFNPLILGSIVGQIALFLSYFFSHVALLLAQPWYCPLEKAVSKLDPETFLPLDGNMTNPDNYPCYPIHPDSDVTLGVVIKSFENTGIWLFTHVAFAIVALSVSISTRYRLPVWTNTYFTSYWTGLFVCLSVAIFLLLNNRENVVTPDINEQYDSLLSYLFTIQPGIAVSFRAGAYFLLLLYGILSIVWELVIVDRYLRRYANLIESTYEREQDEKRDKSVGLKRPPTSSSLLSPVGRNHLAPLKPEEGVAGLNPRAGENRRLLNGPVSPEGFELKPTFSRSSSIADDDIDDYQDRVGNGTNLAEFTAIPIEQNLIEDDQLDELEELGDSNDASFLITHEKQP